MSDLLDPFEDNLPPQSPDREDTPLPDPASFLHCTIVSPATSPVSERDKLPGAFRRQKFPPTTKRLFVPLVPDVGGLNCLALASVGVTAVSFTKTLPLDSLRNPVDQIVSTFHDNLVNLQEVYLTPTSVISTYDSWGVSLLEICTLSNVFARDIGAVATICKEVIKGLQYIHDEIGISHGNVSCATVILTEKGQVKIADVGDSMIRGHDPDEKLLDSHSVCQMAKGLLQLSAGAKSATMAYLEAEDFANTPLGATLGEIHQHPFLRRGIEPSFLRPFPMLLRILHQ